MTRQQTLVTYDLRLAFSDSLPRSCRPVGEGEGGEGDLGTQLTEEELRNPVLKKLHDEAARYRVAARDSRQRLEEETRRREKAEASFRYVALRSTFDRVAHQAQVPDLEAAWQLALGDLKDLVVEDDGRVDEKAVARALEAVAERHPTIIKPKTGGFPLEPSGRPANGPRRTDNRDLAFLESKFPALRRRRTGDAL